MNLAIIYKENKDYEKAIDIINEGIKENENQGFLYYNRACFLVHVDKVKEAFYDIKTSVELNESFFYYMKKDSELNPIRDLDEYKQFIDYIKK